MGCSQVKATQVYKNTPILYFDILSQPSKAVYWWSRNANIDLQVKIVQLGKGEHMSPDFLKINPRHQVPVLQHQGFILTESQAIMYYLAEINNVQADWFGINFQERAQIFRYLSWYHTNLRQKLINEYFFKYLILPIFSNSSNANDEELLRQLDANSDVFQQLDGFLENKKYLLGEKLSVADFAFATDIFSLLSEQNAQVYIKKYGNLCKWIENMKLVPYYEEVHHQDLEYWQKIAQNFQSTGNSGQAMQSYQQMIEAEEKRLKKLPNFI